MSVALHSNKFIDNDNCDSLFYARGPDLGYYQLFLDTHNNVFENNNVNIGIFDLRDSSMLVTNDQILVENCHFTNYSDRNAFKFENNDQIWLANVSFENILIETVPYSAFMEIIGIVNHFHHS